MNEQEAILQLKAGNICGLELLYQDHYEAVFRTAYGTVHNHDLAEDVTHEVFIELFTSIKRYDLRRPFRPWLHGVAVHLSLDAVKPHKYRAVPIEEAVDLPSADRSPEVLAEQSELRDAIWDALGLLDPKHRAAVVLRYYHGFSEAEIAVALRCPRGTVKSRLHYALGRMREHLVSYTSPRTNPGPANPALSRNGKEHSVELLEREPVAGLC